MQYKEIPNGGAIPAENLRFMGQLRSGKNLDISSKLSQNKSNLRNGDPEETDKEAMPQTLRIQGPPSFYDKDYEEFIKRKLKAGKSTEKFSLKHM